MRVVAVKAARASLGNAALVQILVAGEARTATATVVAILGDNDVVAQVTGERVVVPADGRRTGLESVDLFSRMDKSYARECVGHDLRLHDISPRKFGA